MDKGIFNSGQKSWYSFISTGTWNSTKKMNVNLTNFSVKEIPKFITNHYEKFIKDQLKNYMKSETDSKLQAFAKCYEEFKIQPYLNNNLPKSVVKHLTKLRISAEYTTCTYRKRKIP